jgi:hypothetical protein
MVNGWNSDFFHKHFITFLIHVLRFLLLTFVGWNLKKTSGKKEYIYYKNKLSDINKDSPWWLRSVHSSLLCCFLKISKNSKCKTNMIPISMHQMCISTIQVSSVVLRPQKLEIPNKNILKTVNEPKEPNNVQWNCAKSVKG